MRKLLLVGTFAGGLLALSGPVAAQSGGGWMQGGMMWPGRGMMVVSRLSPDDASAFVDAHIAALKAGLQLTPDQERLWPPVEEAMRGLARQFLAHIRTMRQSRRAMVDDPIGQLRGMADRMGQGAEAVRAFADAAEPLYATLDDAQKRRLRVLVRMSPRGMRGPGGRGWMRGRDDDGDDDDDDVR